MSNTLFLDPNPDPNATGGCLPNPIDWTPKDGEYVYVFNRSGSKQKLWNIQGAPLKTKKKGKNKTKITLDDGDGWKGKAGAAGTLGTYNFDDGVQPQIGTRNGRIDPS